MKITNAEVELIEKLRTKGINPSILSANIDAVEAGFKDMNKYLCAKCSFVLGKILLLRQAAG